MAKVKEDYPAARLRRAPQPRRQPRHDADPVDPHAGRGRLGGQGGARRASAEGKAKLRLARDAPADVAGHGLDLLRRRGRAHRPGRPGRSPALPMGQPSTTQLRDWLPDARRGCAARTSRCATGDLSSCSPTTRPGTLAFGRRARGRGCRRRPQRLGRAADDHGAGGRRLPDGTRARGRLGRRDARDGRPTGRLASPCRPAAAPSSSPRPGPTSRAPGRPGRARGDGVAGPGRPHLAPVAGAAGYDVLRSILPGGGYEVVGTTDRARRSTTPPSRNGTRYHYAVVALRRGGQPSVRARRRRPPSRNCARRRPAGGAGRGQPAALGGRCRNADPGSRPRRRRARRRRSDGRDPGPARRRRAPGDPTGGD